MTQRVLIVPDKFKGTLTAFEAAQAIAEGWRRARPKDQIEVLPMSDGGDGFGTVIAGLFHGVTRTVETIDAAHRPCIAEWSWSEDSKTAILETARVIGLAQLPKGKYHPFALDTFGLGAVFKAMATAGANRCLVGIGGSATNDGGFGLARSLGWSFSDNRRQPITEWTELNQLESIGRPSAPVQWKEIVVAVDVENPLLGPTGCSRIYGPQKGLAPEDMSQAESALLRFADCVRGDLEIDAQGESGAGAAGGLGYGLRIFTSATLIPGFTLFADLTQLEQRIAQADIVITAEGSIDPSSLMGKGVGGVTRLCRRAGCPCIAFAGIVPTPSLVEQDFESIHALTPNFVSHQEAILHPAIHLQNLASRVASKVKH